METTQLLRTTHQALPKEHPGTHFLPIRPMVQWPAVVNPCVAEAETVLSPQWGKRVALCVNDGRGDR